MYVNTFAFSAFNTVVGDDQTQEDQTLDNFYLKRITNLVVALREMAGRFHQLTVCIIIVIIKK